MTSAETGGVLYATYVYNAGTDADPLWYTGVARNLRPAAELCCEEADWDYLHAGLKGPQEVWFDGTYFVGERFAAWPGPLKICGCLTADSNSKLWAIDAHYYYAEDIEG